MNLYVLWDSVAAEAGPVFEAKNHDVAIRSATSMLRKASIDLMDVKLFWVGEYDNQKPVVYELASGAYEIDLRGGK